MRGRVVFLLLAAASLAVLLGFAGAPAAVGADSGHPLRSVACPSDRQCTAVDDRGHEVTFDPVSGKVNAAGVVELIFEHTLHSVACPSAMQCTAVDGRGHEVTFDPISGDVNPAFLINGFESFSSVACPSARQCTAVGSDGAADRFDPAISGRHEHHDAELISNTIDELVEPAAQIHTPLVIQATGASLLKEVSARLHHAFPDLHITIEDLIEDGDKVVSRQTVTGTHQGAYMGIPPTGTSITYNEVFIVRFLDRRIAETWGIVDVFSQMRQLGVISWPEPLPEAAGSLQGTAAVAGATGSEADADPSP